MTSTLDIGDAKDFQTFVKFVEVLPSVAKGSIYRGQAVKGNLIPSISRANRRLDTTAQERETLDQLVLLGASLLGPPKPPLLDLMVIAQHFGLKTRLLDWTSNPLAALWFACADPKAGDAFVYVLAAEDLIVKDLYTADPFAQKKTRVFQPRWNNPRIVAQHGWFTLHRYAGKQFVPLESNAEMKHRLAGIRIPAASREGMLRSLDRHGTNHRALFPDVEGLCRYLNWKHSAT